MIDTDDRRTVNGWRIAAPGYSGAVCPNCGASPTIRESAIGTTILIGHRCICGKVLVAGENLGAVLASDASLIDDTREIFQRTWFHATKNENWLNDIHSAGTSTYGELLVHLGSHESALIRALQLSGGVHSQSWFIHEVILAETTPVSYAVADDDNFDAPRWSNDRDAIDYELQGITRYVNSFENPGSVSLIVNSKAITSTACKPLDLRVADEAVQSW